MENIKLFLEFISEEITDKIKFVVDKKNNKFKLFLGNILVSESGFNIENKDKWFEQKYVIIHDFKTVEKFKGKGFAKYLLEQIFNYVKYELKFNIISLIVYKDNYKALNLYINNGFEIYIDYEDSYSLIKKLWNSPDKW